MYGIRLAGRLGSNITKRYTTPMKSLADLLLNHKVPGVRDAQIREAIVEEMKNNLKISIKTKQVHYDKGDVILNVPPVVKSALKLQKENIVLALAARGIRVNSIK